MSTATQTTRDVRLPRVTDDEKVAARSVTGLNRALAILGLINADGTAVICPQCGKTAAVPKKFAIKEGKFGAGFKHFGSDGCWGRDGIAIDLLMAPPLNLSFPDAVRAIVGKPTSVPVQIPDTLPQLEVNTFKATLDTEVYAGVLAYGRKAFDGEGVTAAKQFYGQWHISEDVVEASGAVVITRPDHFAEAIVKRFGIDRLVACGLFVLTKDDRPMCLISKKWPVVEPARDTRGHVVNLQFRASNEQYARYVKHKRGELPYEGNQKFINVRGRNPGMVNIDQIAALPDGSTVFVVEGFKDRLAAATMGTHAVGFPGTSYRPSKAELETLARHKVVLSFDGDEAGRKAVSGTFGEDEDGNSVLEKPGLIHYLAEHGIADLHVHPLRDDMDITDRLVEHHARGGHNCVECDQMRTRLNI